MQEQGWQMPKWWYRKKRPKSDNNYFENMSHVIFQAGLNWQVTEKKWPGIQNAFCNFDIDEVAAFTDADIARLIKDERIIRNKGKIRALIRNAQTFQAIQGQYGSFQRYLDSIDKTDNYSKVTKTLINNFKWLGPSSASTFLFSVGENINVWEHEH
jgi:DNA-3-methyladenine glycosylase I